MSYVDFYFTDMGKEILEIEARYISERAEGLILSIGCGPGLIEERIEELSNSRIICSDSSEEMLKEYRGKVEKILCRAEHLPFKKEAFDSILFITSLEFIKDYEKALSEGYRVLKKGGKSIFLLLNQESRYFKEKIRNKESYIYKNIKHFNMEKLIRSIEEFFHILNKDYIVEIKDNEVRAIGSKEGASIVAIEGIK